VDINKGIKVENEEEEAKIEEMPFILNFLEVREGAVSFTTTGTYENPDMSDTD